MSSTAPSKKFQKIPKLSQSNRHKSLQVDIVDCLEVPSISVMDLTEGSSQSLTMAAGGCIIEHDRRSPTKPKSTPVLSRSELETSGEKNSSLVPCGDFFQHSKTPKTIIREVKVKKVWCPEGNSSSTHLNDCMCNRKVVSRLCGSHCCINRGPIRLKYNGNIDEIGAERHESDDDSDMLSDTSYTELPDFEDPADENVMSLHDKLKKLEDNRVPHTLGEVASKHLDDIGVVQLDGSNCNDNCNDDCNGDLGRIGDGLGCVGYDTYIAAAAASAKGDAEGEENA